MRGTGGKALATDHRAEDLNVSQIESVRLNLGVHAKSYPTTHTTVYGTPWYKKLGPGRAGGITGAL